MKYIAIVDDEFLSNFRIDVGYPPHSDMIMVVSDKNMYSRGIRLKPLPTEMLVTKDGKSVYLQQKHIDCLIKMERREVLNEVVERLMNPFNELKGEEEDGNVN